MALLAAAPPRSGSQPGLHTTITLDHEIQSSGEGTPQHQCYFESPEGSTRQARLRTSGQAQETAPQ